MVQSTETLNSAFSIANKPLVLRGQWSHSGKITVVE